MQRRLKEKNPSRSKFTDSSFNIASVLKKPGYGEQVTGSTFWKELSSRVGEGTCSHMLLSSSLRSILPTLPMTHLCQKPFLMSLPPQSFPWGYYNVNDTVLLFGLL